MFIAPQQDWAAYQTRAAKEEAAWVRSLGTAERFAIYADLFATVWRAHKNRGRGDWEALDRWSWKQKLAVRLRCAEAYQRLDEIHNGRASAEDAG